MIEMNPGEDKVAGVIRRLVPLAVLVALAGCASSVTSSLPGATVTGSPQITVPVPTPPAPARVQCDATLWRHVYHAYRLHVISPCKTVTGTVETVRREPDGDLHIGLQAGKDLVNAANVRYQHGLLVIEAICEGAVTQADAVAMCRGFTPVVKAPRPGQMIAVTGSYVLDADHGWLEIHPVTVLAVVTG